MVVAVVVGVGMSACGGACCWGCVVVVVAVLLVALASMVDVC